jgi:hypothetical protein
MWHVTMLAVHTWQSIIIIRSFWLYSNCNDDDPMCYDVFTEAQATAKAVRKSAKTMTTIIRQFEQ